MSGPLVAAHDIELGGAVALAPMTAATAMALGEAFAAIEPWSRYPVSAAALAQYLAADEPGAPRFAITSSGQAVGAMGVRNEWLRGPYVQFLAIVPHAQNGGLGALALDWLEGRARREGKRNAWVCASSFNVRALAFYARRGYTAIATLDGLITDGIDEILLRKRL